MFGHQWRLAGLAAATMLATPASAAQFADGYQVIENFEGYPPGTSVINFSTSLLGTLSGGAVTTQSIDFPAASGTQVYVGTLISFSLADSFNDSWPAVMATITSVDPVQLQIWQYDYDLAQDVLFRTVVSPGNLVNAAFGTGDEFDALFITRFEYSAASAFAIDDLKLGLPTVGPGIPEPANWALLIAGFGLVGAALRHRVRTAARPTG